jgi:chromosomal replication initiation ATPase DnaA
MNYQIIPGLEILPCEVSLIIDAVTNVTELSYHDLCTKSRLRKYTLPRHVAMYLIRYHTELTFIEIGKLFDCDHSTAIFAIKAVQNDLDIQLRQVFNKINQQYLMMKLSLLNN